MLNLTPHSFSHPPHYHSLHQPLNPPKHIIHQPLHIIHLPPLSTPPPHKQLSHKQLSLKQQINPLFPLVHSILKYHLQISLDTFPTQVPQASLKLPLSIINHHSPPLFHSNIFNLLSQYPPQILLI
ncbi:dihydropteroate synthase, partial [Staphylococcus epidermidis]|uniref:dihydropteroate synthase n=1 Tax=Staphylococcus epidermidis TaxID=1282 RepID=UPI0037D9CB0F